MVGEARAGREARDFGGRWTPANRYASAAEAIPLSGVYVYQPSPMDGTLRGLLALSEAYPDLKANQNMMQLSEELTSTENRIAFARQAYNDSVMAYNNRREVFPSSVVAGMFNFEPAALLDIPADRAEVREAPKVQF